MDTTLNPTGWTTDQWNLINRTVTDEVNKASVAGAFLPIFGPLPGSVEDIRHQNLITGDGNSPVNLDRGVPIMVDDQDMLRFWTNTVYVSLKQQQVVQPHLGDALLAFRRAANILARAEDAIVLNGLKYTAGVPDYDTSRVPANCKITGNEPLGTVGLYETGESMYGIHKCLPDGESLVRAVAAAITALEGDGHLGPFACVMGDSAYVTAYTPNPGSLVLPSDRIQPMLGMSILRSGTLAPGNIVVVALAGGPVDVVVATSPVVQYLQMTLEARYVFRVYERFVLRIKEYKAIYSLDMTREKK